MLYFELSVICVSRGGWVSFCDTIYHKVHTVEFRQFNELMTRCCISNCQSCADPEGGMQGVRTTPAKSQKYILGFLSNAGLDHLKITKMLSQHSMLGHHRHASETPFKWRFAGVTMI